MVLFDISSAFLVGAALGWRSQGTRRDLSLTAAGLGIAVPGLTFLEAYPDWDWQYLLDPGGLPPGVPAIFVACIFLAALAGHWMSQQSMKTVKVISALFGLYCLWSIPRFVYVGTTAEYTAGQAAFLPGSFLLLLGMVGVPAVIVLGICWRLAGQSSEPSAG